MFCVHVNNLLDQKSYARIEANWATRTTEEGKRCKTPERQICHLTTSMVFSSLLQTQNAQSSSSSLRRHLIIGVKRLRFAWIRRQNEIVGRWFNTRPLEDATVEELETRAADIPESDSAEE